VSLSNRRPAVLMVAVFVVAIAVVLGLTQEWLLLAVWLVIVLPPLELIAHPWRRCRHCEGGRVWNMWHTAWDDCNVCDGRGKRPRMLGAAHALRAMVGIDDDD
jgi:hypothetical protein